MSWVFLHVTFVSSAVVMSHQEPISMRDPKFVSVAATVFTLHMQNPRSRKKSVSKHFRKNKSDIQFNNSKILRRGKARLFKQVKAAPPVQTRKHMGTTSQTKVSKKQVKRPKQFSKPKKRHRGRLTASDLWRLNRSSHKFTKTMGRKGRNGGKGRKSKQRYSKVRT